MNELPHSNGTSEANVADEMQVDLDTTTEQVLLAASNHDIPTLEQFFATDASLANTRDSESLITPLHAALLACQDDEDECVQDTDGIHTRALDEQEAVKTIRYLFENGAIWNDLDLDDETPGCVALRLGLKEAYEIIVEAGVRAELLLHRLDAFQLLGDGDEEDDDDDDDDDDDADADGEMGDQHEAEANVEPSHGQADQTSNGNDTLTTDDRNTSTITTTTTTTTEPLQNEQVDNPHYLASHLAFDAHRLLDQDRNGVMMDWESDIMQKAADDLLSKPGLRVLNIGHGMGIIDGMLQQKSPIEHHIVEAHPDVLANMRKNGWMDKQGVVVHEGKWQDVVTHMDSFDAIYFDTFAEDYADLRDFFTNHVPRLLVRPSGRFGFFNGLGADRQVCQDVYRRILELDLFEAGMDVTWTEIDVPELQDRGEWDGVRRQYWSLKKYAMPTCEFVATGILSSS